MEKNSVENVSKRDPTGEKIHILLTAQTQNHKQMCVCLYSFKEKGIQREIIQEKWK